MAKVWKRDTALFLTSSSLLTGINTYSTTCKAVTENSHRTHSLKVRVLRHMLVNLFKRLVLSNVFRRSYQSKETKWVLMYRNFKSTFQTLKSSTGLVWKSHESERTNAICNGRSCETRNVLLEISMAVWFWIETLRSIIRRAHSSLTRWSGPSGWTASVVGTWLVRGRHIEKNGWEVGGKRPLTTRYY